MSPTDDRPDPAGTALMPERHEDQRERHEVVAEAVAELDPALAEVHQVDEGDREDGDDSAGDDPARARAAQGGDRQQVGRGW